MYNITWLGWNFLLRSFTVADYKPDLTIADQYGGSKRKKLLKCDEIWYSEVFAIADYESELNIQKFQMSNSIWRAIMQKARSYAAKVSL